MLLPKLFLLRHDSDRIYAQNVRPREGLSLQDCFDCGRIELQGCSAHMNHQVQTPVTVHILKGPPSACHWFHLDRRACQGKRLGIECRCVKRGCAEDRHRHRSLASQIDTVWETTRFDVNQERLYFLD